MGSALIELKAGPIIKKNNIKQSLNIQVHNFEIKSWTFI